MRARDTAEGQSAASEHASLHDLSTWETFPSFTFRQPGRPPLLSFPSRELRRQLLICCGHLWLINGRAICVPLDTAGGNRLHVLCVCTGGNVVSRSVQITLQRGNCSGGADAEMTHLLGSWFIFFFPRLPQFSKGGCFSLALTVS